MLGARVLHLLTRYGEQTDFFAPDVAFKEAREHLPGILERLKVPVPAAMAILDAVGNWFSPSRPTPTQTLNPQLVNASSVAMRRTGQSWLRHLPCDARFGRRMLTSSVVAWRLGQLIAWIFTLFVLFRLSRALPRLRVLIRRAARLD